MTSRLPPAQEQGASAAPHREPAWDATRPLTEREFSLFQALVFREAGIYLSEAKKALLAGRLARRLRALRLRSYGEYYRLVAEGGPDELVRMLDCICTNETHFFREPRQFQFLEERVLPRWAQDAAAGKRPRRIRVWSAGCSTGEEPYSVAMLLLAHFPPAARWEIEILATDLSTKALERAEAAIWPLQKAEEIPESFLKAFMLKGHAGQEGLMKAGPEVRQLVRFERLNLNEEAYPKGGLFDLVFCRNVLIYFKPESKARIIDRLLNRLDPSGYLFLGHAESLNCVTERVRSVIPTVYAPAGHVDARPGAGGGPARCSATEGA